MMSYEELATYLMIETIREALVRSQLVMYMMEIDQLVSETAKGEPK